MLDFNGKLEAVKTLLTNTQEVISMLKAVVEPVKEKNNQVKVTLKEKYNMKDVTAEKVQMGLAYLIIFAYVCYLCTGLYQLFLDYKQEQALKEVEALKQTEKPEQPAQKEA